MLFVAYLQKNEQYYTLFSNTLFLGIYGKRGRILRAVKQYCTLLGGGKKGGEGSCMGTEKDRLY
jgi:hypothetical protein